MGFPDISNLTNTSGVGDFLSLPNATYPFFWVLLTAAIAIIIASSSYYREKAMNGRGNLLSSLAVAALAMIVLSTTGSLLGIITSVVFVPQLVLGIVIIAIWIFSG